MKSRLLLWLPLAAFAGVMAVIAAGLLRPADRTIHSALVGRRLPAFALPPMLPGRAGVSDADFRHGRPRLVNVFASWCIPCAAEAPQLGRLRAMGVAIDGVAIRDTAPAIAGFLRRNGDPYDRLADDRTGRFQLALGSSGVPETFVIAGDGTILQQHIGDIRAEEVAAIARRAGARP